MERYSKVITGNEGRRCRMRPTAMMMMRVIIYALFCVHCILSECGTTGVGVSDTCR